MKAPAVRWFYDETWKQNVYVLDRATTADLKRFVWRQFREKYDGTDGWDGRCLYLATEKCGGQIIIGLKRFTMTPEGISTLAHECFHAAEYMLAARAIVHGEATSEVFAYLTDSLLRRCLRLLTGKAAQA